LSCEKKSCSSVSANGRTCLFADLRPARFGIFTPTVIGQAGELSATGVRQWAYKTDF
jgi:hypothetical protein